MTDSGMAQRLFDLYGQNIRYCYRCKRWLIRSEAEWQFDLIRQIYQLAFKTVETVIQVAFISNDIVIPSIQKYYNLNNVKKMISLTRELAHIDLNNCVFNNKGSCKYLDKPRCQVI
jgi:hypothetical protein